MKKLERSCVYRFEDNEENEDDQILCESCSRVLNQASPLDGKSLDVFREWHCNVPLHFQIVLETFLNQQSAQQSTETEKAGRLQTFLQNLHFGLIYNPSGYLGKVVLAERFAQRGNSYSTSVCGYPLLM